MIVPGRAHTVLPGEGRSVDLGVVTMRVLAAGETTDRAFTLAEFFGNREGAWTVPHIHRGMEESFFILEGLFTFSVGDRAIEATPGTYILVPRGTAHTIAADEGGGRFLTLMVPGGLEEMFFELARLPTNANPAPGARAAISPRHDSVPVEP
jgi:quercetin dioxygenase-like cupin family protein